MVNILIPANGRADWQQFLAEPVKHWKRGYSACTLAHSWHDADGFPSEVKSMFMAAGPFKTSSFLLPSLSTRFLSLRFAPKHHRMTSGLSHVALQVWFPLLLRGKLANHSDQQYPNGWQRQQWEEKTDRVSWLYS